MEKMTYGAIVAKVEQAFRAAGLEPYHIELNAGGSVVIRACSKDVNDFFKSLSAESAQNAQG
jgi:hypothetical protein